MNLISKLQQSITSDDVEVVLLNTRLVAFKLGRTDIAEWLEAERKGYGFDRDPPDYRMVDAIVGFKEGGPVMPGFGFLENIRPMPTQPLRRIPIREPIGRIVPYIEDCKRNSMLCLYRSVDEGSPELELVRSHVGTSGSFSEQVTFLLHHNMSQFRDIPAQIKHRVLDWALELESAGVVGEDMSFTDEEKQRALSITWNIFGCDIGQLSNLGNNRRE